MNRRQGAARWQHVRMVIVQFRLLGDELVQIILPGDFIEGPGRATKKAEPVSGYIW